MPAPLPHTGVDYRTPGLVERGPSLGCAWLPHFCRLLAVQPESDPFFHMLDSVWSGLWGLGGMHSPPSPPQGACGRVQMCSPHAPGAYWPARLLGEAGGAQEQFTNHPLENSPSTAGGGRRGARPWEWVSGGVWDASWPPLLGARQARWLSASGGIPSPPQGSWRRSAAPQDSSRALQLC